MCARAAGVQSLAQRVKAFGIEHADSVKQWKKLNTEYNVAAMKLLQNDDFETVCAACTQSVRAPGRRPRPTRRPPPPPGRMLPRWWPARVILLPRPDERVRVSRR